MSYHEFLRKRYYFSIATNKMSVVSGSPCRNCGQPGIDDSTVLVRAMDGTRYWTCTACPNKHWTTNWFFDNVKRHIQGVLYENPKDKAAEVGVEDELTQGMEALLKAAESKTGVFHREDREFLNNMATKGHHECVCGATSTNVDYLIGPKHATNSLCVHYLRFHRAEISPEELKVVADLVGSKGTKRDREDVNELIQEPTLKKPKEEAYEAKMAKEHADEFVRKTSHEWYLGMPQQCIQDPDGWRNMDGSKQAEFWHTVPISWKEFRERHAQCSVRIDPSVKLFPYGESYEKKEEREVYLIQRSQLSPEVLAELCGHLRGKAPEPKFPEVFAVEIKSTPLTYATVEYRNRPDGSLFLYTQEIESAGFWTTLALFRAIGVKQK